MPKAQDDGRHNPSPAAIEKRSRAWIRQLRRQLRAAPRRTWFRELRDDLLAARTPLLTIAAYFVILFIPDQSADSIRTLFEESTGWLTAVLVGWGTILVYLASALVAATFLGFKRADRLRGRAHKLSSQRWIMLGLIVLAVPLITIFSILASYAPSFYISSIPSSIILFSCSLILFCPLTAIVTGEQGSDTLIGAAGLCFSFFYLGHFFAIGDFPPPLLISAWIVVVLGVLEIIELLSTRWGVPVFAILLICFLVFSIFDWNDNHELRKLTIEMSSPPSQNVRTAFEQWLDARQTEVSKYEKAQKPYPVFILAAEGGGIRAAFLTALVLEKLRLACPDALRHTFLTIGVSGGSVGATLAHAAMKREGLGSGCGGGVTDDKFGPITAVTKTASEDLLRPLLRGMLFIDLPSQITPLGRLLPSYVANGTDRARYLESGISYAFQRHAYNPTYLHRLWWHWRRANFELDDTRFRSIWGGPAGPIPALMLLATDVNSGRRVAASHVLMPPAPPAGRSPCLLSDSADKNATIVERARVVSLAELLPEHDVSASTAAVLSARFPGITPAASLQCGETKLRLVDGGYFENSGLTTAIEVTREILETAIQKNALIRIISIENSDASPDWRYARGLPPAAPSAYLPELMSPFRAMEGTRQAHADLAHASLDELLKTTNTNTERCKTRSCLDRILFRLRRCKTPIPLGWSLSEAAGAEIRRQLFNPSANDSQDCLGMRLGERTAAASFDEIFSIVKLGDQPN